MGWKEFRTTRPNIGHEWIKDVSMKTDCKKDIPGKTKHPEQAIITEEILVLLRFDVAMSHSLS